jgi:hypothetical protein
MTQFFNKFPVFNYANTAAVNLLARVNMNQLALNNKQAYYDYVIKEGERIDSISYNYYSNSDFVWLIGLANQIIDPYYDLPLNSDQLNNLIINKYGSLSAAQSQILFFRTNYVSDDSNITVAAYNSLPSALPTGNTAYDLENPPVNLKKYWAPFVDNYNKILYYVRKQEDWVTTTNQTQQLTLIYSNYILTENGYNLETEDGYDLVADEGVYKIDFVPGEIISQNGVSVATVDSITPTGIIVKHISGSITTDAVVGLSSGATATATAVTTLQNNIPSAELNYWSPVYAYDYEVEMNNAKKNIKLLDNRFSGQVTKELKKLLLT